MFRSATSKATNPSEEETGEKESISIFIETLLDHICAYLTNCNWVLYCAIVVVKLHILRHFISCSFNLAVLCIAFISLFHTGTLYLYLSL